MNASYLRDARRLLEDRCLITIALLMQYNNRVSLRQPVRLAREPEMEVTGIEIRKGKMLIVTRSFGILYNRIFPERNGFLVIEDYISILSCLEQQSGNTP